MCHVLDIIIFISILEALSWHTPLCTQCLKGLTCTEWVHLWIVLSVLCEMTIEILGPMMLVYEVSCHQGTV